MSMRATTKTPEEVALIEKIKAEQPRCVNCGRPCRPHYRFTSVRVQDANGYHFERHVVGVHWYGRDYSGFFCTLRCGFDYGVKAAMGRG